MVTSGEVRVLAPVKDTLTVQTLKTSFEWDLGAMLDFTGPRAAWKSTRTRCSPLLEGGWKINFEFSEDPDDPGQQVMGVFITAIPKESEYIKRDEEVWRRNERYYFSIFLLPAIGDSRSIAALNNRSLATWACIPDEQECCDGWGFKEGFCKLSAIDEFYADVPNADRSTNLAIRVELQSERNVQTLDSNPGRRQRSLVDLLGDERSADVEFLFPKQESLFAHCCVLANASDYYKKMFLHDEETAARIQAEPDSATSTIPDSAELSQLFPEDSDTEESPKKSR